MRTDRCTSALSALLAALALGACAVAAASAAADTGAGTGGVPAADGKGASLALSSRRSGWVGRTLRLAGADPRAAGHTVLVQAAVPNDPWTTVATAAGDGSGAFRASWTPTRAGLYSIRAVLADGQAGEASSGGPPRTITVYRRVVASWYGPGFYGRRTACGVRLTRATMGVAHRRLPCGTLVSVSYRGHRVTVPVIDRGPYARRVSWDLTSATAKALGVSVTSRVGVAPIAADPPVGARR
ncbi:MAG: hypothetical protein IRZ21_09220 [Thermoleophilaceae bacterium]|nr:hypothetical protein [Thermoleophilaceae bacterium]